MKKTLVAVAALTMGSAFAQSSATLYGVIDTAVQRQTNATPTGGSLTAVTSGSISGSRWGVRGVEDLGAGLKTIFTLEAGFNPANGSAGQGGLAFGRQAFVGLSGDFGKVTTGRQYSIMADHDFAFDPMFGVSNVNESTFYLAYGSFRQNNTVRYNKEFGPIAVTAMYGFGNVAKSTSAGAYSGASVAYIGGALNASLGYQQSDANSTSTTNLGTTKNTLVAANYGMGPARAYFNYLDTKLANNGGKSDVSTLGVSYDVTPLVSLIGAYYYDKTNTAAGVTGSRSTTALAATYTLSKRTMVYAYVDRSTEKSGYAAFAIPAGSDIFGAASSLTGRNNFMVGVRHAF